MKGAIQVYASSKFHQPIKTFFLQQQSILIFPNYLDRPYRLETYSNFIPQLNFVSSMCTVYGLEHFTVYNIIYCLL